MRPIDADNLIQYMEEKGIEDVIISRKSLEELKQLDVVEVVRCKDCRYYQDNNGGYPNADCKWCKDETPDANDYCSCGERKDDE